MNDEDLAELYEETKKFHTSLAEELKELNSERLKEIKLIAKVSEKEKNIEDFILKTDLYKLVSKRLKKIELIVKLSEKKIMIFSIYKKYLKK